MKIIKRLKQFTNSIKNKYEIRKYNNLTIAEYFRKQGAQIGENCHLGIRTIASEPYLVKIGNHVGIAGGTQLITHTSGWNFHDKVPDLHLFGKVTIGNNCYLGANVIVLPDVTIGDNCILSAGAIVTKDIPANSIAAGVPAKVIGDMDTFFEKIKSKWKEQKPENYMSELVPGKEYTPVELFVIKNRPENKAILRKHLTQLFWGQTH